MGIKYKRGDLNTQIRALAQANSEFKTMVSDELETLKPAAVDSMQFHSDLHKNRISGDMVDAMGAEVSKTGLQLRFGFIKAFKDYFGYQTVDGFTHWSSGKFIAPSLALQDAKLDVTELMNEAMKRVRRNFMARLRRR